MRALKSVVAAFLLTGFATAAVDAHGIWFAERSRHLAFIYGIGADDLDAVQRLPQVESITAYDARYAPIPAALRVSSEIVLVDVDGRPALVAAVLQNGTWSRMDGGEFEKKGRDEMPGARLAEKTVKYAVAIQRPLTAPIPALPSQILQIVPVTAIPAKLGQPLTYRVLFKGKPLAGARMIADMVNDPDAVERRTGADGTITFPVRNQGLNVIRAVYDGPTDDSAKYDRIEHTATLSFTLAHAPE